MYLFIAERFILPHSRKHNILQVVALFKLQTMKGSQIPNEGRRSRIRTAPLTARNHLIHQWLQVLHQKHLMISESLDVLASQLHLDQFIT